MRAFRRLWAVLAIASLGDWLGLLATALFAAEQVSGDAARGFAFGGVIAVRLLPALVLGPLAGVFADRFDRRRTMVVTDVARFALFASIPIAALVSRGLTVIVWTAVATFLIEAVTMVWLPAKDAALPTLLPRARLDTANQLSLVTTYGAAPVVAALLLAGLETLLSPVAGAAGFLQPVTFALYLLAALRLLTALVVGVGLPEIGGGPAAAPAWRPTVLRAFRDGWRYLSPGRGSSSGPSSSARPVRGLVLGLLAVFAAGGVVVGSATFYAASLGGGETVFAVLFAMIFVGLAIGISLGPLVIGALSRRRWFSLSIVLAGLSVALMTVAWQVYVAIAFVILVGIGAGMAYLAGTGQLADATQRAEGDAARAQVFGFVTVMTRVVLMLAIAVASVLVGLASDWTLDLGPAGPVTISSTRVLLLATGVLTILAGVGALRQVDDKPGVPVLHDLWSSLRGHPIPPPGVVTPQGVFVVFEGGEGAGKTTQVQLLAKELDQRGLATVVTREPGATALGARIRRLLLDRPASAGPTLAPRAEALLYAADRAHHVASLVRPALDDGKVVISDRYVDSSLAYQGAGRVLPVDEIAWVSSWATGGLRPDLVVLLDLDPGVGLARAHGRGGFDRLESEAVVFHERVRHAFLDRAAAEPRRYLVIDAAQPVDAIAATVLARVDQLLPTVAEVESR